MLVNIEAERVRKQMTKEEASAQFGVSLKTYYNWVNEAVDIPSSKLKEMANYFGVTMEYLVESNKKGAQRMDLSNIKTCELVAELEIREGVEKVWAEPYQAKDISVEGPAVILIVTD